MLSELADDYQLGNISVSLEIMNLESCQDISALMCHIESKQGYGNLNHFFSSHFPKAEMLFCTSFTVPTKDSYIFSTNIISALLYIDFQLGQIQNPIFV